MATFTQKSLKTDVTALQFYNKFLFAGIGGQLYIYNVKLKKFINQKTIFEGQKIHGIRFNSDNSQLIVYGGRNIAILSIKLPYKDEIEILALNTLSEWILDALWINNNSQIAIIYMRNRVQIRTVNLNDEVNHLLVECEESCILYSAHLSGSCFEDLLVFAGTIFNQILLWKPFHTNKENKSPVLKRLKKHNGVIFNIFYHQNKGYITTVSDDRSAILWQITPTNLNNLRLDNSDEYNFIIKCQVYEHSARIFRCFITKNYFLTAGEDSLLIVWNFDGQIIQKIDTHQSSCAIWSLAYDDTSNAIYIGRGDGGISCFKINATVSTEIINLTEKNDTPKLVGLFAGETIVCFSEKGCLYSFHGKANQWMLLDTYNDLKNYCILQVSPCRKLVALAGFNGQIYIYKQLKQICKYTFEKRSRIYSFYWINCKTFLVCQDHGELSLCILQNNKVNNVQKFILPMSKERWLTCAVISGNHIIVGDRKGNIHNYKIGAELPINTLKKAHSYLGVSNIYVSNEYIVSLGRNGVMKTYKIIDDYLECKESNKLKFNWLIAMIDQKYLLSFSGKNFVISDYKNQRVLFETFCGGGHRSWNYIVDDKNNFALSFIKQKSINTIRINLNDFIPQDVIQGYHVKEINCIEVVDFDGELILISGGEDTILRFATIQSDSNTNILSILKVHLSSIRCISVMKLKKTDDEYLMFSAGGRGQIIYWHFTINRNTNNSISINSTIKYNLYEPQNGNDEAEIRIMDLSTIRIHDELFLAAGCSDGAIKLFSVGTNNLDFVQMFHHRSGCITKIINLNLNNEDFLLSMATDGYVKFWKITKNSHFSVDGFKIHQSGISGCSSKLIDKNCFILLTGGDDNSIKATVFKINQEIITKIDVYGNNEIHCAQISGVLITDEYVLTSSIDQKIVLYEWTLNENVFNLNPLSKYISTIADQKGMAHINTDKLNLFIYGNGVEHLILNSLSKI